MPMMKSPFDQILVAPNGTHSIAVEADVPVWIPPGVQRHASANHMSVTDDTPPAPIEAPEETTDNDENDEFNTVLDQAIIRILTRNDESDFKNDGTPNANRVTAEMGPDVRRPTATEVSDAFMRLQENIDLAE